MLPRDVGLILTSMKQASAVVWFGFESWSLRVAGYPGTYYVDQAGPELTEILLPLPPESWDYRYMPPPWPTCCTF